MLEIYKIDKVKKFPSSELLRCRSFWMMGQLEHFKLICSPLPLLRDRPPLLRAFDIAHYACTRGPRRLRARYAPRATPELEALQIPPNKKAPAEAGALMRFSPD